MGILAEFEKKSTFGSFANVNLKPTGDKKFLFPICEESARKKELIDQEMETEEFKKVLAKFPNAKIIDIEDIERGDENDG